MKIQVAKKDLEHALKTTSVALAKKGGLESHYIVRSRDGSVEVLTQNQQVLASAPLICQVDGEDGSFTVEGWRLDTWLKGVEDTALTLEPSGSLVKASSPAGTVRWAGLDPSVFPFWDKGLAKAEKKATIKASRLWAALSHTKDFIYDQESVAPHLALTEVQDGCLKATDLVAMTLVESKPLMGSNLRVHNQQVGPVLSYLSSLGDGSVDLLEYGGTLYFKGEDGSMFGVAIPLDEFPDVSVEKDEKANVSLTFKVDAIRRAMTILSTAANRDNNKVRFLWDAGMERAELSVDSSAGDVDKVPLPVITFDDVGEFPAAGFAFSIPHLLQILDKNPTDTIKFDLVKKKNKKGEDTGLIRFLWEAHQDTYLTAVLWL